MLWRRSATDCCVRRHRRKLRFDLATTTPMDVALSLLAWGGGIAAAYAACYAVGHRFPGCPAYAGDVLFGFGYYPVLVLLAADATSRLHETPQSRWRGTTASSKLLGRLLVSRMLVHLPYLYLKRDGTRRNAYVFHHCLVAVNYGAGVVLERSQFWGAAAALCEATNVFLNFQELGVAAPEAAEKTPAVLRDLNDFGLKATYVVFRLALFPSILGWQFFDRYRFFPIGTLGLCEGALFPASILFVFLLSLKWALDGPSAKAAPPSAFSAPIAGRTRSAARKSDDGKVA